MSYSDDSYEQRAEERARWRAARRDRLAIHGLWALIAVIALLRLPALVGGCCDPRPAAVPLSLPWTTPTAPGAKAAPEEKNREAALAYLLAALAKQPGDRLIGHDEAAALLEPFVKSGAVPAETAAKLVDALIVGGREITVDTVKQLLAKLLAERNATAAGPTVSQVCTLTTAGQAAQPDKPPPPPAGPGAGGDPGKDAAS